MDEMLMKIGEFAAFFDISVKSLRIYERMGILKPVKIDDNTKYRYYSADQIMHLDALLGLKRYAFSLFEIKHILENKTTKEEHLEQLNRKISIWQNRIEHAKSKITKIDDIISKLENSKPATKIHELTDEERAQLLNGLVCLKYKEIPQTLFEALYL